MRRLIGYVFAHGMFQLGDKIGWFEDWRTDSLNMTWLYRVANWLLNESYWAQKWGGCETPWFTAETHEIAAARKATFDEDDKP